MTNDVGVGCNEIAVCPPIDTKYSFISMPPVSLGALQLNKTCPLTPLGLAVNPVGALGTVDGVADADADALFPF